MKRFLLALALLGALSIGCTENFLLNTSGTGTGSGGLDIAITALTIEPSQFELQNGDQVVAEVRAFAGSLEVQDFRFTATVEPNQSVATIQSVSGNLIRFKAENPGNSNLVIKVRPGVEARAPIKVVKADE